jgi:hypothetical protein
MRPFIGTKSNHATLVLRISKLILRPKINSLVLVVIKQDAQKAVQPVLLLQCGFAVFDAKRKNNCGKALQLFFRFAVVLRAYLNSLPASPTARTAVKKQK